MNGTLILLVSIVLGLTYVIFLVRVIRDDDRGQSFSRTRPPRSHPDWNDPVPDPWRSR